MPGSRSDRNVDSRDPRSFPPKISPNRPGLVNKAGAGSGSTSKLGSASTSAYTTRTHNHVELPVPGTSPTASVEPNLLAQPEPPSLCTRLCGCLSALWIDENQTGIPHDVYHLLKDEIGDREMADLYITVVNEPPITYESLRELRTDGLINNAKLRQDINFDQSLHFRPNLDSNRGRLKSRLTDDYWKAIHGEFLLSAFVHQELRMPSRRKPTEYWRQVQEFIHRRLPKLLYTLREMLRNLVPSEEETHILDSLDVPLLMQQIKHGLCDLVKLANWFAVILKKHCAPMRDKMVDDMRNEIGESVVTGNVRKLTGGMRLLSRLFEAIALDLANYQIRFMRTPLVQETINFQRRYQDRHAKIPTFSARTWFRREARAMALDQQAEVPPLNVLTSAFLRELACHELSDGLPGAFPQIFYLDTDRLKYFQTVIRDRVFTDICVTVLCETAGPQLTSRSWAMGKQLRTIIPDLVGTDPGKFTENIEPLAAEMMRIIASQEGRSAYYDHYLVSFIEDRLRIDLSTQGRAYDRKLNKLFDHMLPELQDSVNRHIMMTPLALHDKFVCSRESTRRPSGQGAIMNPVPAVMDPTYYEDDLIRLMTHVIVLHWQVWAESVYLIPLSAPMVNTDIEPSPQESQESRDLLAPRRTTSDPMPVSEAVYRPGVQFLSNKIKTTSPPPPVRRTSTFPLPLPSDQHDTHMADAASEDAAVLMDPSDEEMCSFD